MPHPRKPGLCAWCQVQTPTICKSCFDESCHGARVMGKLDALEHKIKHITENKVTALNKIRLGLEILEKHGGDELDAEHDILYAHGPPPQTLPVGDVAQLEKLGWFWDAKLESWSHFT